MIPIQSATVLCRKKGMLQKFHLKTRKEFGANWNHRKRYPFATLFCTKRNRFMNLGIKGILVINKPMVFEATNAQNRDCWHNYYFQKHVNASHCRNWRRVFKCNQYLWMTLLTACGIDKWKKTAKQRHLHLHFQLEKGDSFRSYNQFHHAKKSGSLHFIFRFYKMAWKIL